MIRRLVWVGLMCSLSMASAQAEITNRIIARVNDEIVTEGDVRAYMNGLLSEEPAEKRAEAAKQPEFQEAAIRRLIEERLIVQEAKRLGLTVSQSEVIERLRALKAQAGSSEAYEQMLDESGLTEEQLKLKLRDQLLTRNAITQAVRSTIRVSPSEVAQATATQSNVSVAPGTEEMLVWHLLVRTKDDRSPEAALALAEKLRKEASAGASLDTLAREHSDDPHAAQGGMLGWVRPGQLLPELDQVLATLPANELAAPIQSKLGAHLVKVLQRRPISSTQSVDPSLSVEERLYREKFNAAMQQWIKGLWDKAYLEIIDD